MPFSAENEMTFLLRSSFARSVDENFLRGFHFGGPD